jgi:hypothetical protein
VPAGADGSAWLAHVRRERRYWIALIIGAILGLVLGHFASQGKKEARLACDARGGRLETTWWGGFRCIVPGEPAAP